MFIYRNEINIGTCGRYNIKGTICTALLFGFIDIGSVRGSSSGTIGYFTNGTIGLPMVPLGEPMVPLVLPSEPMVKPMVSLVEPCTTYHWCHW